MFWFEDLGDGWAPAAVETQTEFVSLHEQDRLLSDARSYWIGEIAYQTLASPGYFNWKQSLYLNNINKMWQLDSKQ